MRIETDRTTIEDVTADQLIQELALLDGHENTRAILSRAEEYYLQTAVFDNGFVIEKREGSENTHSYAVPRHPPLIANRPKPKINLFRRLFNSSDFLTSQCAFSRDDMTQIFVAYFAGKDSEIPLTWDARFCDR